MTQIKGGFFRKLDAEQVILYRDDWIKMVVRHRAQQPMEKKLDEDDPSLHLLV